MENVPSKASAARVIFFGSGQFLVLNMRFFVRMEKNVIQYALPSCEGKIILGWVTFPV